MAELGQNIRPLTNLAYISKLPIMPRSHIHGLDAGLATNVQSWQSVLVRSFPYCIRNYLHVVLNHMYSLVPSPRSTHLYIYSIYLLSESASVSDPV